MTKQEFKTLRGRYRRAVRDTWFSYLELIHAGRFDDATACSDCCRQLLQEFAAAIGRPHLYPSAVLSNTLGAFSWVGGAAHE